MEIIQESLNTPVEGNYDVIVCGGGPSGTCAAVAAARAGAKTLLLERESCLGGMWTSGFVNPLFDQENKGGILRELIDWLDAKGVWGGFLGICFQYEYMKNLLEETCRKAGVKILYGTSFSRALTDGNRVTGVIAENVAGRAAYLGKAVIDATGDAAVAASAGAKILLGDWEGKCQSMTLMFLVGNVPEKYRNREGLMFYSQLQTAFDKEGNGRNANFSGPFLIPIPGTTFATVQMSHMYDVNPLSPEEMTEATCEGRRQIIAAFEALKGYDPDFRDLELITSAARLGVRESRRIVGEYTLTVDDLMEGKSFPDDVTVCNFNIDIHQPSNSKQILRNVKPYGIPYRTMIPVGLDALLVAGKTISGTHEAMASYRVTGDCAAMGEAAGLAAAYTATHGTGVREVPIRSLLR